MELYGIGSDTTPWYSHRENIKSVIIVDGVTTIGDSAFFLCAALTSITIPNSVTAIGNSAFEDCVALLSAPIPDSVTSIGDWAFSNCKSLESITIPDAVTIINDCTFSECGSLKSITLPKSITSIGNFAFYYCDSLESVTIPDSVKTIGENAFDYCNQIKSVTIPKSVTSIGNFAFGYSHPNPTEEKDTYFKIENFTITGVKGSEAERYATENEFAFNSLDITTLPEKDYYLNKEDGTMPNLVANTLVSDLISTLEEYGITATVTDKDGNTLKGTKKVGTNCKVITPDGEYVVIVKGDVTGDGSVSSTDYLQVKTAMLGGEEFQDNYKKAADCDNDDKISSTDYLKIKNYFLGNYDLYA